MALGARLEFFLIAPTALGGPYLVSATPPTGVEWPRKKPLHIDAMAARHPRHAGNQTSEAAARAIAQPEDIDRRLHRARSDVDDTSKTAAHHAVDGRLDELDWRQHVGVDRLDPVV